MANFFNYKDNNAVAKLTKKVIRTEFKFYESEDGNWSHYDEQIWKSFCDRMGAIYTPFPDMGIQPLHIKTLFLDNEEGIESKNYVPLVPMFNPRTFEMQSTFENHPNYVEKITVKSATSSEVNLKTNQGTLEGHSKDLVIDESNIKPSNYVDRIQSTKFNRKKKRLLPSELSITDEEKSKALIVR